MPGVEQIKTTIGEADDITIVAPPADLLKCCLLVRDCVADHTGNNFAGGDCCGSGFADNNTCRRIGNFNRIKGAAACGEGSGHGGNHRIAGTGDIEN